MRCTKCGALTKVLESREKKTGLIRRRRECLDCKYRFRTYEADINTYQLMKIQPPDPNQLPVLAQNLIKQILLVKWEMDMFKVDESGSEYMSDFLQAEADFLALARLSHHRCFQVNFNTQPFTIRVLGDFQKVEIDLPVLLEVA